jgi:hypothetical protein
MPSERDEWVQVGGVSHSKHLFLTLITAGLWIPFWIVITMFGPKKRLVRPEAVPSIDLRKSIREGRDEGELAYIRAKAAQKEPKPRPWWDTPGIELWKNRKQKGSAPKG